MIYARVFERKRMDCQKSNGNASMTTAPPIPTQKCCQQYRQEISFGQVCKPVFSREVASTTDWQKPKRRKRNGHFNRWASSLERTSIECDWGESGSILKSWERWKSDTRSWVSFARNAARSMCNRTLFYHGPVSLVDYEHSQRHEKLAIVMMACIRR